jgi:predicted dehydrogenase
MAGQMPVQVGLILRAHLLTLQAREILRGGGIGRLLTISGDFSGWKRMRCDSDLVHNDGVHFLDLMRHLGQSPIQAVDATSQVRLRGTQPDDIRIDTRLANGVTGELRLGVLRGGEVADSVVPGARTRKVLTLCGDGGVLELDFNRDHLTHCTVAYCPTAGGWHPEPGKVERTSLPPATPVSLLRANFEHFLTAVDAGQPPMCDLTEGAVELSEVCEAVAAALARGARLPVRVAEGMEATG